jgi:hypothetical protein
MIDNTKASSFPIELEQWHDHKVWWPRAFEDGGCSGWFEVVQRRGVLSSTIDHFYWIWLYRSKPE